MDYSEAVSNTWKHHDLSGADPYKALVHYATLAASSHNTQPWKFKIEKNRISILPDLSRRCPAVDPDDHHLYASLGCATENLVLAARAAGLEGHVSFDASSPAVRIDLEDRQPERTDLFDAIPDRCCTRAEYDGKPLSGDDLALLEAAGRRNGVFVVLLTTEREKEKVAEYVAEGNRAQIGDSDWLEELKTWIRFNAGDAVKTGDGLYARVMGNPNVPSWLGRLVMRLAFSAKSQNKKDVAHIRSSGAVAVFVSEVDEKRQWVEAGRSYERFALEAAASDLRTAFINQPVEVTGLRPQFAGWLGIGDRRPDLVVRVGHGPRMPRSLRRPVADVLV